MTNDSIPITRGHLWCAAAWFFVAAGALIAASRFEGLRELPSSAIPTIGWKQQAYSVHSAALGQDVEFYVSTPPSYAVTTRRYPVMLLLDGEYYQPNLLACASELAANGAIPESILVAIHGIDRRLDFTPNEMKIIGVGGGVRGDAYLKFLADELVPLLEGKLRAGLPRILIGHSHGGIFAAYAASARPEAFSWILALDAPMQLDDSFLSRHVLARVHDHEALPLRYVSVEKKFGWSDESWAEFERTAPVGSLLWRLRLDDERHESLVMPGIYTGLKRLFADYSAVESDNDEGTIGFIAKYESVAKTYGVALPPPKGELRRTLDDAISESDRSAAKQLLAWEVEGYGAPKDREAIEAKIAAISESPKETVASMLALPHASATEIVPILGEWTGEMRFDGTSRDAIHVTFEVDANGVGQGRVKLGTVKEAPTMELTYLRRIADDRFEFGFQNGMRPRGMLIYEGHLVAGRLRGIQRLRGIDFTRPDGSPMPVIEFDLEKVVPSDGETTGK